jgi:hypothetical protein
MIRDTKDSTNVRPMFYLIGSSYKLT